MAAAIASTWGKLKQLTGNAPAPDSSSGSNFATLPSQDQPDYDTHLSDANKTVAGVDASSDRNPRYSRADLLALWRPHLKAQGLPTELLHGGAQLGEQEWTETGYQDHRSRRRLSSSEHHSSLGGGRIPGGLRGRGGGGLQGGVLSGLGAAPNRLGRGVEPPRQRARTGDEPPVEKWAPRKPDAPKAETNAWRRTTDMSPISPSASPVTPLAQPVQPEREVPASWDMEEPADPVAPVSAPQQEPLPAIPIAASPQDERKPSPLLTDTDQTAPVRQTTSRISALSFDDELYVDPLLSRRSNSGSAPISRSNSSRDVFAAPQGPLTVLPPGLPPVVPNEWCYRDPHGNVQGPFPAAQMQEWHASGFFSEDLMLNRVGEREYIPLGLLLRIVQEPDKPFTSSLLPPPVALHQPPLWQQQPPPPRHFTNDYDPFGHPSQQQRQASPVHHLGHDVFGRQPPQPRRPSASVDPWGVPLQQPQPTAFSQTEPWQLPSAGSSRQASFSHSPLGQEPQQSASFTSGAFDLPGIQNQAWQSPDRFASTSSETQPLLGQREAKPILPQPVGTPKYSLSPAASGINLAALAREPESQDSHVNGTNVSPLPSQEPSPVEAFEQPTPVAAPVQEPEIDIPDLPPPPPEPVEEPSSPAALKGKSKRQAAKDAKSAARKTAEDATVPQPSEAPPVTPPRAKAAPVKAASSSWDLDHMSALEPAPDSGWHVSIDPEKPVQPLPAPSPSTPRKAAVTAPWAAGKDDGSAQGSSLRDIQAREAKQAQMRKAAERQSKAAAVAAEAAQLASNELSGLPGGSSWANEPSPSVGSAWAKPALALPSSGSPSNAKSLKDIQEEEARRKQAVRLAQQQQSGGSVVSTPTRGGYAGSVGPAQPKPPAVPSGPWMTVGQGGKVSAPPPGVPRPSAAATKPAAASPSRPIGLPKGTSSNSVLSNDNPPAPSAELMKWVRTSLQGFSGNLEDFIQLLFSFPLEPDELTREIITESVYANSKTLDGKRFATEFITRRKADARGIAGGKVSSMADAVKNQPVKQPTETFKVVKAKGKKVK